MSWLGRVGYMNKHGMFLLTALLVVTLPMASAASGVQVTLLNFYLGGTPVEIRPNPPQSLIITLDSEYVGQGEAQIVITAVNPDGESIKWSLWAGLVNTAILGQSDVGFVGDQTGENSWIATTEAKRVIITVTGTVDWTKVQEDKPVILVTLGYSVVVLDRYGRIKEEGAFTPLLSFSIVKAPEPTEPTDGSKLEAQAVITELETEFYGSNLPDYRRSYYESQLYKAKLYLQSEDYDSALITAQMALNALRAELAEYNSPINVISRFLYNNIALIAGLSIVAPLVFFAFRLRGGAGPLP